MYDSGPFCGRTVAIRRVSSGVLNPGHCCRRLSHVSCSFSLQPFSECTHTFYRETVAPQRLHWISPSQAFVRSRQTTKEKVRPCSSSFRHRWRFLIIINHTNTIQWLSSGRLYSFVEEVLLPCSEGPGTTLDGPWMSNLFSSPARARRSIDCGFR